MATSSSIKAHHVEPLITDLKAKRGELGNCKIEPRKIKMLLHDDIVHQILQWLPVMSLLRFKLVCRTWRALIESSNFIEDHLHLHHFDPNMKDKNHNLIYLLKGKDSPITYALTSIEGFEEPKACLRLNCLDLCGSFPIEVVNVVSYDGIICLNLSNRKGVQSICLWNPATKQSRVLPQLADVNEALVAVGFGFDVKNNDYKVVNLIRYPGEMRVEVYNLKTNAWRSVTTVFPYSNFMGIPWRPFNNGTCFFWLVYRSHKKIGIFCFDLCSEMFRYISFPCTDYLPLCRRIMDVNVVLDKIACVFTTNHWQIEVWVFNEYGTVNESWTKLCAIDTLVIGRQFEYVGVSMNGNYIFFATKDQMCRFNVATKETNHFALENMPCSFVKSLAIFKESAVSVLDA